MKRYFPLLVILFFCGCGQDQAPDLTENDTPRDSLIAAEAPAIDLSRITADDRTYVPGQRIGLITGSTSPEQLSELYGAENVLVDSIHLGEGFYVPGYRLFPGTTSEIALMYPRADEVGVRDLQVTIDEGSTDWRSAQNGIGIGTTLEELVRANGHPFTFYGFDWDYGGVVTDWQSGALSDHRLRLTYDYANRPELHPTVRGEGKVVSNSPYVDDLGIKVVQIIVRLPK